MITRHQQIRQCTDGTIDIEFYRAQALSRRFRPSRRLLAGMLSTSAMTLGPASAVIVGFLAAAGMVHVIKGAPPTAVTTKSMVHPIDERAAAPMP
jgi:hypothetical protein